MVAHIIITNRLKFYLMIRKRIVHLDFKNNSLRRVFFLKGLDGSGFCDREEMEWFMREEMEWFMQEISRALRIPRNRFDNIPQDTQ